MSLELVKKMAKILDDKKGFDIEVYHVEGETSLTEYLILASGTSSTHIRSLAGYVEEIMKNEENTTVHHTEGYNDTGWVLLDYVFAVVNVFDQETRKTYNLEGLWGHTEKVELNLGE